MVTNQFSKSPIFFPQLRVQALLLALITLALFYPLIFAGFNSLDDEGIVSSVLNTIGSYDFHGWTRLFFRHGPTTYYRPLVWATFLLDHHLHLCDPSFMHLENILIHTANVFLVFLVTRKLTWILGRRKDLYAPFITALLFAIHPVNTEAVDWIAARTDLMAGFFIFSAFYCLFFVLDKKMVFLPLSGLLYLMALFSKEAALGFIPFLPAFLFFLKKKGMISPQRVLTIAVVFVLATGLYISMRGVTIKTQMHQGPQKFMQAEAGGNSGRAKSNRAIQKAGVFVKVTGFYFKKLFWPWPLNFAIVQINRKLCLFIGLLTFFAMLLLLKHERYGMSLSFFWALAFMLPAIGVVYTRVAWTPLAERYLYMSSFGTCLITAHLLTSRLFYGQWPRYLAVTSIAVIVALFGFTTYKRNLIWQSNLSLYEDTVAKSPGFAAVHNQYALALWAAGKRHKARAEFKKAAELAGIDDYQYVGKANALAVTSTDTRDLAEKYYAMASKVEKPKIKIWLLGKAIHLVSAQVLKTHDINNKKALYEKQIRYFKTMAELKDRAFYTYRIGQRYLAMGMKEEAAHYFEQTRRMSPNSIYGKAAKKLLDKLTSNPIS